MASTCLAGCARRLQLAAYIIALILSAAAAHPAAAGLNLQTPAEQSLTEQTEPDLSAAVSDAKTTGRAVSVTDYRGQQIRLSRPATRILALSPHIVENAFSAGAGKYLVGVVEYADYPEQAISIERVGSNNLLNMERIVSLQPDLIIAWGSGNKQRSIAQLEQLGFSVYVDEPKTLEDIARSITDIGVLAGTLPHAETAVAAYRQQLIKLGSMPDKEPPISVFYQVWNEPLQTLNGEHLISQAISLCGGINIFAQEQVIAPVVSIESVLARDPQVVLASGVSAQRPPWLDEWLQWRQMRAVKSGHLFHVPPDLVQRHTLRLMQGIEIICRQLSSVKNKP
ncbi:MAG: cobalamin-binding protein [Gammaproteobacteria bacterium]|nr:cobalamin-binding protein [Gammaproteobacteria bacterium]